jgi:hypothetical protein
MKEIWDFFIVQNWGNTAFFLIELVLIVGLLPAVLQASTDLRWRNARKSIGSRGRQTLYRLLNFICSDLRGDPTEEQKAYGRGEVDRFNSEINNKLSEEIRYFLEYCQLLGPSLKYQTVDSIIEFEKSLVSLSQTASSQCKALSIIKLEKAGCVSVAQKLEGIKFQRTKYKNEEVGDAIRRAKRLAGFRRFRGSQLPRASQAITIDVEKALVALERLMVCTHQEYPESSWALALMFYRGKAHKDFRIRFRREVKEICNEIDYIISTDKWLSPSARMKERINEFAKAI